MIHYDNKTMFIIFHRSDMTQWYLLSLEKSSMIQSLRQWSQIEDKWKEADAESSCSNFVAASSVD